MFLILLVPHIECGSLFLRPCWDRQLLCNTRWAFQFLLGSLLWKDRRRRRDSCRHVTQPTLKTEAGWSCYLTSDSIGRRSVTPKSHRTSSLLPFHWVFFRTIFLLPLRPLKTRFLGATVSHRPAYIPLFCTLDLPCELFFYSEGGGSSPHQSVCALLADYTTFYRWRKQSHLTLWPWKWTFK